MGEVVKGPDHWRATSAGSGAGAQFTKASKVISSLTPFSAASRTREGHRWAGMPRLRQVLTVLLGTPSAAATTLVPPKASMAEFGVSADMAANIVRGLRTCQGFAKSGATSSALPASIGAMKVNFPDQAERLELLRLACGKASQKDWLAATGFAKSSWSEWESGEKRLTLRGARIIKKKYGIPLDYSLDGDEAAIERMPLWIAKNLAKLTA